MKKETFHLSVKSALLLSLIAFFEMSCSSDEIGKEINSDTENSEDVEILAEIQSMNVVLDDMSDMVGIEIDQNKPFNEDGKLMPEDPFFSSCVSRTIVLEGNSINVSLDYGSGCEGPHGNVLAGLIRIDIQVIGIGEQLITQSFEGFSINGRAIEGSIIRNRIRSNQEGYPQVETSKDLSIQWDENTIFNRVGQSRRIWVSGFDTWSWGDDVFLTSGNWNVLKNGVLQRSVTISKELRREMSCRFLVSGTLEIEGSVSNYTLDFGNGTCDDVAVVTIGERQEEIQLGRLRRRLRK